MAIVNKTFRIFVSSTFSDLKEERNALQREVFPKLRNLCMQHGFRFQAVDLRWGIREESALDQQTMNICLSEIARCQRPPRPSFIVLLGDRYGWQPLPTEIPANEFEQIDQKVSNGKDKVLLNAWYKRDDNAVPAVYSLQPREVEVKKNATEIEKQTVLDEERKQWGETEPRIREILRNAIAGISLTEEQKIKYRSSATEQEITAGALNVPDAREHVAGFFREIEGLPQDESAEDYIDLIIKGREKQVDTDAKRKLNELKSKLRKKTGDDNIFTYKANWKDRSITTDHLIKFCNDAYKSLLRIIEKEISLIEDKPPLEREIDAHDAFGKDRAEVFVGRTEILRKIQIYINGADKHPLAIYGESGTGKSALMAYSLKQLKEKHSSAEVIFRFIGATPESSDGRALLESLCRQMSEVYRADVSLIPGDYKELIKEFPKRLALAAAGKQLIIFLDALDQLSDVNDGRNLTWLPGELPGNVRLIVSTLPGECCEVLKRKLTEENLLELRPMLLEEGEELLSLWLKDAKRALQANQKLEVLGKFHQNGLPLYLKLAFEEARRWKSYSEKIKLDPDIKGVIHDLFKRLSADENHGEMMVSHSLGYLAAAKNGLSEDELIDVLSQDEEVFIDFKKRSFHEPPEQRLPVVIWARLYFDIESYLTERSADGTSLISFYHQQFNETTVEKYLSGEDNKSRHQGLAEYFGKQSLHIERDDKKTPNLRKLSELPFQQTYGKMWKELYNTLTDNEFLEQKNTHFIIYDLLDDFRTVLGLKLLEDEAGEQHNVIQAFSKTLDKASFVLKENPELTFPQLYNRLQWHIDKNLLLKNKLAEERSRFKKPWLHLITRPSESSVLIRTFSGHTASITACVYSPDGKRILSASNDKTLKLWDVETGEEISTFKGHTIGMVACAFSPDGKRIVSAEDGIHLKRGSVPMKIWDTESGKEVFTLNGHSDRVGACAFSLDGRSIQSASWDSSLKLWDAETGEEISALNLSGHEGSVTAWALSPDGSRIVSGSSDRTLKLWDTESGKELFTFNGHTNSVLACTFSHDGKRIVSGSKDETLKLWNTETGEEIYTLKGHSLAVVACVFSPDDKRIVSGSTDNTLKLWDAELGEEISTLRGHTDSVQACTFSHDGKHIVSGSSDHTLKLWDAELGEEISIFKGHTSDVNVCVFSPDGKRVVSGSADETLKLWDGETGDEIYTLRGHTDGVTACTFSPDGKRIVSASWDKTLKLWDVETGEKIYSLEGHTDEVRTCAFSPDGRRIISASRDKTLKLWDVETGEEISSLEGHTDEVGTCAFSPDGRFIISVSYNDTLKLWDAETGEEIYTHQGCPDCAFSPDGKRIVSGSYNESYNNTLKLWDVETGEEIFTFSEHEGSVTAWALSHDGSRIICGSYGTLKLWNVETGKEIYTLKGHTGFVRACDFSPDGKHIISGSEDETLKLWNAETGEEIFTFKGHETSMVYKCAFSSDGGHIVLADYQYHVLLLSIENVELLPIVSSIRIWHFHNKTGKGYWDDSIKTTCQWCGERFSVSDKILDAIKTVSSDANLSHNHSSNFHLPNKAWEDPRLLSECPHCHKPLRYNPFIVDNNDRDLCRSKEKSIAHPQAGKKDHLIPFNQGKTYYDAGKFEEAIQAYNEAIQVKPDHEETYFNLGLVYRKVGRLDEAITAYKAAVQIKPDYELAYFFLGGAYMSKEQLDEAKKAYKNALRLDENDKYAHFNLGLVYKKEGNFAEARYHFKRALDLGYEPARSYLND